MAGMEPPLAAPRPIRVGLWLPHAANSVKAGYWMQFDCVGGDPMLVVEEVPEADAGDRGAAVETPAAPRRATAGLLEILACGCQGGAGERADCAARAR